jgi:ASC-1-like (ASCH) protein
MKTIIIDNQEYELTPINKYKAGDWVIFNNGSIKPIVRKIIEDKEYINYNSSALLDSIYKEWMTNRAANEHIKNIVRKATENEIKNHLADMARQKGLVKGAKVKRLGILDDTTFVTIVQEDDDYYFEQDEYCKSGIILYSKGNWVTKIEEPKFSFGGCDVTFQFFNSSKIKVTCKEEIGFHTEIEKILAAIYTYNKEYKFGNVSLKKEIITTCKIGCLQGEVKDLEKIYKHCLILLEK